MSSGRLNTSKEAINEESPAYNRADDDLKSLHNSMIQSNIDIRVTKYDSASPKKSPRKERVKKL